MTKQEEVLSNSRYIPLHNHGFVGLIDTMGDDHEIARAARVSYGAGTKSVSDDRNLLRYLMRNAHSSPYEMAEVKFHMKCPIVVMRQIVRHRTARFSNLNEYSGRFSEMSDEFYLPEFSYIQPQATTNKQGRAGVVTDKAKGIVRSVMERAYKNIYADYKYLLAEADEKIEEDYPGIARELARLILPVANYTECYWKIDLHNFCHFLKLRMAVHAQQETRDFASAMYNLAKPFFPLSMEAFEDYVLNAKTFSRMDLLAIKDMLSGTFVTSAQHYGMSKREYSEFADFFTPSAAHSLNLQTA